MATKLWWVVGLGVSSLVVACGGNAAGHDDVGQPDATPSNDGGSGESLDGNGGAAVEATLDECAGTDACKGTCAAAPSACLHLADGSPALENGGEVVELDAKVTSVTRERSEDVPYDSCVGTPTADRIRVSLEDGKGAAWELLLSPEQVDEHRYAVGDELWVGFSSKSGFAFARETGLSVRAAGKLDLFFVDSQSVYLQTSPSVGFTKADDSGLTFENASVKCAGATPSGATCSTTGVAVSDARTSVSEPCDEGVGDFEVTATYRPRYCSPGTEGFCDALPSLFAAGTRRR